MQETYKQYLLEDIYKMAAIKMAQNKRRHRIYNAKGLPFFKKNPWDKMMKSKPIPIYEQTTA